MDKKEYNKIYFQNNKDNIYTNYKRRYHSGKKLSDDKPNWYIKRKYKTVGQVVICSNNQNTEPVKQVSSILVTFD